MLGKCSVNIFYQDCKNKNFKSLAPISSINFVVEIIHKGKIR